MSRGAQDRRATGDTDADSYLIAGRGPASGAVFGDIVARARGPIRLTRESYFISAPGGAIDVVSESEVQLLNSYFTTGNMGVTTTPPGIRVRARALTLGPEPNDPSTGGYVYTNSAGGISIDVREDVSISGQSYLATHDAVCGQGPSLAVRAEGDIRVLGDSEITAGSQAASRA